MNSNLGTINWKDAGKALLIFVLFTVVASVSPILEAGEFPTGAQWAEIAGDALKAVLAYIGKQLITNSDGALLKKEVPKAA